MKGNDSLVKEWMRPQQPQTNVGLTGGGSPAHALLRFGRVAGGPSPAPSPVHVSPTEWAAEACLRPLNCFVHAQADNWGNIGFDSKRKGSSKGKETKVQGTRCAGRTLCANSAVDASSTFSCPMPCQCDLLPMGQEQGKCGRERNDGAG